LYRYIEEVADYWYSVVGMNDYQKSRFVKRVVSAMVGGGVYSCRIQLTHSA
jgi:hypothetical protein